MELFIFWLSSDDLEDMRNKLFLVHLAEEVKSYLHFSETCVCSQQQLWFWGYRIHHHSHSNLLGLFWEDPDL